MEKIYKTIQNVYLLFSTEKNTKSFDNIFVPLFYFCYGFIVKFEDTSFRFFLSLRQDGHK